MSNSNGTAPPAEEAQGEPASSTPSPPHVQKMAAPSSPQINMEPPGENQIPGLSLIGNEPTVTTTTTITTTPPPPPPPPPQNTHMTQFRVHGSGIDLDEWLKAQPEPPPTQQPTAPKPKEKPEPTVFPIPVDPNEKANYIGKLHQYWDALDPDSPGVIDEGHLDLPPPHLFYCTITYRNQEFGGPSFPFVKKKDAKQHAAKLVIQWLIKNDYAPPNYVTQTTPLKKQLQPSTPAKPTEAQSAAAQVHYLAQNLGLTNPQYVIKLENNSLALYSGYCHFPEEPQIEGRVAAFRNIWGKKNAKEECAKEVLKFLKGLERLRSKEPVVQDVGGAHKVWVTNTSWKRKVAMLESTEQGRAGGRAKMARSRVSEEKQDEDEASSIYGTSMSS